MSGFRSIAHQGFVTAKTANNPQIIESPYPLQSDANHEFMQGVNAFNRGDRIGKDGYIHSNRN